MWKKFRRGERHDTLRDLIPSLLSLAVSRPRAQDALRTDDFWVLENVSFSVKPGDALGIIGPNGAGKSSVGLILFDEDRRKPRVRLQGLASFTVEEHTRAAGYAELEPEAHFRVTG